MKQTVYLLCGTMKDMRIEEAKGEIIELTNNKGYTTRIALLCKRPYWYATHYETGLDCTPSKPGKYGFAEKTWRKQELIEALKEIDFERLLKPEYINKFKAKIEEYKTKGVNPQ